MVVVHLELHRHVLESLDQGEDTIQVEVRRACSGTHLDPEEEDIHEEGSHDQEVGEDRSMDEVAVVGSDEAVLVRDVARLAAWVREIDSEIPDLAQTLVPELDRDGTRSVTSRVSQRKDECCNL